MFAHVIDNYLKPVSKEDFIRIFKIASITFLFIVVIHYMSEGTPKNYTEFLVINLVMSFSITTPASLAGSVLIVRFTKEISLTKRSIMAFTILILSLTSGIFLGQFILWLLEVIKDPFIVVKSGFWPILIFSCGVAFISTTYYTFKEKLEEAYEKIRIQERQKSELEILKTKAELEALQAKINPHFLFNSLNSIAGLTSVDPSKAEEMTLKLSELFRSSLKFQDDSFSTLEEEIHLIQTYLEIEKIRFGKRLHYEIDIADTIREIKIPQLLIQPIVENSIKHGIEPLPEGGTVRIKVFKEGGQCVISVSDTGKGFSGNVSFGYGLTNINKRLTNLFNENFSFQIESNDQTRVFVKFPV